MRIFSALIVSLFLAVPASGQNESAAADALRLVLATEYAGYDVVFLDGGALNARIAAALDARVLPFRDVLKCTEVRCMLTGGLRGAFYVDDVSLQGNELTLTLTHWRQGEFRAYQTVERHTLRRQNGDWVLVGSEPLRES